MHSAQAADNAAILSTPSVNLRPSHFYKSMTGGMHPGPGKGQYNDYVHEPENCSHVEKKYESLRLFQEEEDDVRAVHGEQSRSLGLIPV